jgi:hypothetical protein
MRTAVPGTIAGISVNGIVIPDSVIPGALRIADLTLGNGYKICRPVAGSCYVSKGGFPDLCGFHICSRIGVTDQRMGMFFQITAHTVRGMHMVFLCGTAEIQWLAFYNFEAGFVMDVDRGFRFGTDKNRFCGLCWLRLSLVHAADNHRIPLIAVVVMSVAGIFRDRTGQHLFKTAIGMNMIFCQLTLKLRLGCIAFIAMGVCRTFFYAADRNCFIAGRTVAVVFGNGTVDGFCIAALGMFVRFLGNITDQFDGFTAIIMNVAFRNGTD